MAYAIVALSRRKRRLLSYPCRLGPRLFWGPMHDPVALLWVAVVVGMGDQHVVQTPRRWHGWVSRPSARPAFLASIGLRAEAHAARQT